MPAASALLWALAAVAFAAAFAGESSVALWRSITRRLGGVVRRARAPVVAGVAVTAISRWAAVGLLAGLLAWSVPDLMADTKRSRERRIARLEALAKWLEHVADNLRAGGFLYSTLMDSRAEAPSTVRAEVENLCGRIAETGPAGLADALQAFADQFEITQVDEACVNLAKATQGQARDLSTVVARCAADLRERIAVERELESGDRRIIYIELRAGEFLLVALLVAATLRSSMFETLHTRGGTIFLVLTGSLALLLARSAAKLATPPAEFRPIRVSVAGPRSDGRPAAQNAVVTPAAGEAGA